MLKVIKYLLTILLIPIYIMIKFIIAVFEFFYCISIDIGCVLSEAIDNMYNFWFKGGWKDG